MNAILLITSLLAVSLSYADTVKLQVSCKLDSLSAAAVGSSTQHFRTVSHISGIIEVSKNLNLGQSDDNWKAYDASVDLEYDFMYASHIDEEESKIGFSSGKLKGKTVFNISKKNDGSYRLIISSAENELRNMIILSSSEGSTSGTLTTTLQDELSDPSMKGAILSVRLPCVIAP